MCNCFNIFEDKGNITSDSSLALVLKRAYKFCLNCPPKKVQLCIDSFKLDPKDNLPNFLDCNVLNSRQQHLSVIDI